MARGIIMSKNNLKTIRSVDEARKLGRSGGLKSGEARREKKALRERLELLLAREADGLTTAEAITIALIEKALSGDVRAYEVIRDTIGEKPVDKQQTEISGGITIGWL